MSELYGLFDEIFLSSEGVIRSSCGEVISCFDHHFFHLAKVSIPGVKRLFMRDEKTRIMGLNDGFGTYDVFHKRAKYLRSAYETLAEPDEVWELPGPGGSARWAYVKEYDSKPYPFSVALVTERDPGQNVPVSSFPCRRTDVKKWRRGLGYIPRKHSGHPAKGGPVDTLWGFHPQSFTS